MKPPRYWEGKPIGATDLNKAGRVNRQGQISGGPGIIVNATSRGTAVGRVPAAPVRRALAVSPPFWVVVYQVEGAWKAQVTPGTLNGLTPVVGNITGTGGTSLTATPRPYLTLVSGENMVVLAVKVDLETHEVLRSTVEVREDSDLSPVTDTGARTLIKFVVLAELSESGGAWSKLIQARNTNLTYDYGVVYNASA